MRIGLDARSLTMPRPRGTGRNLLDAYRLIPRLRPAWQFVLYHQRPLPADLVGPPSQPAGASRMPGPPDGLWRSPNARFRRIDMPGDRLDAWFQVRLPLAARGDEVDLLHFPANAAPAWCPIPFVITIHDLIPLRLGGELSPRRTRAFRRGVRRGIRRAVHIITVSAATRDELEQEFGVPRHKVTVIPWAPDSHVQSRDRATALEQRHQVREKYRLGQRWLLSFSGSTPRKNADGVLAGFARVRPELRADVDVVLVGCEPAERRAHLATLAERLGIAQQCRILGFAPHGDLPALLGGAAGLLMPSRYEGFGLPILDAFACDVPVLTSYVSSMPEVAGDAAVYCDPDDPESIAAGIEQLLHAPTAAALVERGRARLARFSWEHTAKAMCAVYEQCLVGRACAANSECRIQNSEFERPARTNSEFSIQNTAFRTSPHEGCA